MARKLSFLVLALLVPLSSFAEDRSQWKTSADVTEGVVGSVVGTVTDIQSGNRFVVAPDDGPGRTGARFRAKPRRQARAIDPLGRDRRVLADDARHRRVGRRVVLVVARQQDRSHDSADDHQAEQQEPGPDERRRRPARWLGVLGLLDDGLVGTPLDDRFGRRLPGIGAWCAPEPHAPVT